MDKVGILVQVIQDLLIERLGEASDRDTCKVLNNVVSIADSVKEINVPISSKTEKSIIGKVKSIKLYFSDSFILVRSKRM